MLETSARHDDTPPASMVGLGPAGWLALLVIFAVALVVNAAI